MMNNKIFLAAPLFLASFPTFSFTLLDVPLAKKCYAVYLELQKIEEVQTREVCKTQLRSAVSYTRLAAEKITIDDRDSKLYLGYAITPLRYAQVYSCEEEERIATAENTLVEIQAKMK